MNGAYSGYNGPPDYPASDLVMIFSSFFYKLDGKQVLASPDWTLLYSAYPKYFLRQSLLCRMPIPVC